MSIYSNVILADNPVGYWQLNDSGSVADDLTSGSRDGAISGGVTRQILGPIKDDPLAMSFNGSTGKIIVSSTPNGGAFDFSGVQPYSVELWAYASATSPHGVWKRMVEREIFGSRNGWSLLINQDTTVFAFERWANNVGKAVGSLSLPVGFWCYLLGTYDGSNMRAYLNNVLSGTTPNADSVLAQASQTCFGADTLGTGSFWFGGLDQIAIYNYVLSTQQRTNHFLAASQVFRNFNYVKSRAEAAFTNSRDGGMTISRDGLGKVIDR